MLFLQANELPTSIRTIYECAPIFPLEKPWQLWLAVVLLVIIAAGMLRLSFRDSILQLYPLRLVFVLLRLVVFAGIVLYLIQPGQRSESRLVRDSRLLVLIDTSLSMGLSDAAPTNTESKSKTQLSRMGEVVGWLQQTDFLERSRRQHEVCLYRFSESSAPELIRVLPKLDSANSNANSATDMLVRKRSPFPNHGLAASRRVGWGVGLFAALLGIGLLCGWISCWRRSTRANQDVGQLSTIKACLVCASALGLVTILIGLATCDLLAPEFDLLTSLGWRSSESISNDVDPLSSSLNANEPAVDSEPGLSFEWATELAVRGTSTQIGEAIQSIINQERGGPIAGLILITDGQNNAGISPMRAIAAAENAGIPIFPVGIGSSEVPRNVKVADVQFPPRVFPGDKFQIKALIKSNGMPGTTVQVHLCSVDEAAQEAEFLEAESTVLLPNDGLSVPVDFTTRRTELGRRKYLVRVINVANEIDTRDNERGVVVDVVDRQTQVLLLAGGPMREFQFLRNQLYRDKDINLHVWMQSAEPGADQESDVLLHAFPDTREQLFEFDCIVAFDPDWRELTQDQAILLERWVAEQAGGLVVVAGPVSTPEWTRRPRGDEAIDLIRRLYPISFYSQGSAQLKLGRFGGEQPFQMDFSREGRAAEYLWLGDSAAASQSNWDQFAGVFGYYAVNEPKPGADVLAYFSDATAAVDDRLPIYLASQYYGAGRVFFQASGEMWRIRRQNVEFFQQYYTRLIRWAAQGRLLRDSTRGVLIADRDRCWMGDQIAVQAILRTLQDEPLLVPDVIAALAKPDGSSEQLVLRAVENAVRPGSYAAEFIANQEGQYRVSLPIPDSVELDILTTEVQASIPDLEQEKPQRNDVLLTELAEKTSGHYYIGLPSVSVTSTDPLSPDQLIQPQDQVNFLTGSRNANFHRKLLMWLLAIVTVALSLEWTLRRVNRMA